jgi:small subunit ribosomal protein S3
MGQKTNPIGFRIPLTKNWQSKWYADKKDFGNWLNEDIQVREFIKKKLEFAAVPKVTIERAANRIRVTIFTARPGIVIGRKGAEIDKLKEEVSKKTGNREVYVDIQEIKDPETNAQLVAENVALQLERRISFRRAMKKAVQTTMERGAQGIRIRCAGRLGGAELARTEKYLEGKVPLHTLREEIDFGFAEAKTVYGKIGVKCWVSMPPATPAPEKRRERPEPVRRQAEEVSNATTANAS